MSRLTPDIHPQLTQEVIGALQTKSIVTVLDFIKTNVQQIANTGRLTFKEALAIKRTLLAKYSAPALNGLDYYRKSLKNTAIISTGIQSLDTLLEGGLCTGNIYEICGGPAAGKTLLSLNLARNISLSTKQNILYIDTKNDFSGMRLKSLFSGSNQEIITECLSRILVSRAYTIHELIQSLGEIKRKCASGDFKIRVIIIDSLPAVVLGSCDVQKTNFNLNQLANVMRLIAVEFYIVVIVVNLVTNWNEGGFTSNQTAETIACGKYWHSIANVRLKLEIPENEALRNITMLHSYMKPKSSSSICVKLSNDVFE